MFFIAAIVHSSGQHYHKCMHSSDASLRREILPENLKEKLSRKYTFCLLLYGFPIMENQPSRGDYDSRSIGVLDDLCSNHSGRDEMKNGAIVYMKDRDKGGGIKMANIITYSSFAFVQMTKR